MFFSVLPLTVTPILVVGQYEDEVLAEGSVTLPVTIQLPASYSPVPDQNIGEWRGPDGNVIMVDNDKYTSMLSYPNVSLTVHRLGRSDAGEYTVTVMNDGLAATANFTVEVYGEILWA